MIKIGKVLLVVACLAPTLTFWLVACQPLAKTAIAPARTSMTYSSQERPEMNAIEKRTITAPDGTKTEVTRTERQAPVTTIESKAEALGPGLDTASEKAASEFHGGPSELTLPQGGKATGGGADISSRLSSSGSAIGGVSILYLFGGVFVVAGIAAAIWLRLMRLAGILIGIGAALFVAGFLASNPLIVIVLVLVAVAGLVAYVLWEVKQGRNFKEALRATVAGIHDLPAEVKADVKASVAKHADPKTLDTITIAKVKAEDGIS